MVAYCYPRLNTQMGWFLKAKNNGLQSKKTKSASDTSSTSTGSSDFEKLNKVMNIGTSGHSIGITKTMVAVGTDSTGDMRELYKLIDT